jgi:hypothetical protein
VCVGVRRISVDGSMKLVRESLRVWRLSPIPPALLHAFSAHPRCPLTCIAACDFNASVSQAPSAPMSHASCRCCLCPCCRVPLLDAPVLTFRARAMSAPMPSKLQYPVSSPISPRTRSHRQSPASIGRATQLLVHLDKQPVDSRRRGNYLM